jgi:hypothetical protein
MTLLSEERTARDWEDEFEDIIDDSNQNPIQFYEDEDVQDLGPAIAEGQSLREVLERYQAMKRDMDEMED